MPSFEDVMSLAVQLPMSERERLAQALGLKIETVAPGGGRGLPLTNLAARPDPSKSDPVAWRKAETGHAVLATHLGLGERSQSIGAEAIAGMWAHRLGEWSDDANVVNALASELPKAAPALAHTDVCVALALGHEKATAFWQAPPVEIRLATATYLSLLGAAENEDQLARLRRFVQPFAVLSLGPMASSRSVELMLSHTLDSGLAPLDALIAATALAHDIPLVTCHPAPFAPIVGLQVVRPY